MNKPTMSQSHLQFSVKEPAGVVLAAYCMIQMNSVNSNWWHIYQKKTKTTVYCSIIHIERNEFTSTFFFKCIFCLCSEMSALQNLSWPSVLRNSLQIQELMNTSNRQQILHIIWNKRIFNNINIYLTHTHTHTLTIFSELLYKILYIGVTYM